MKPWIALLAFGLLSCGAATKSKKPGLAIAEAYYTEEIGGIPSAGIQRIYYIQTQSWPEGAIADSLCLNDQCLALDKAGKQRWQGNVRFLDNTLWPVTAKAKLKVHWEDQSWIVELDSLYRKESVALP